MDRIVSRENMMTAYHRVVANKGAPGIDKMSVEQLKPYLMDTGRASKKNCWRTGTDRRRCAGKKFPSPAAKGCGYSAFRPFWTGRFGRRSIKF